MYRVRRLRAEPAVRFCMALHSMSLAEAEALLACYWQIIADRRTWLNVHAGCAQRSA
jgi:hypothetical protein